MNSQGILSLQTMHRALGVDHEAEKRALEQDAEWSGSIQAARNRPDMIQNLEAGSEQAEAQARSQVAVATATLDETYKARERLARNPELVP